MDGKLEYSGIASANPFRYRGYYYDTETGFYYLQTRYYDPEIGRFINADDYELVGTLSSVPGQLNMYAYCNNNPVMYTDESGNFLFFKAIIGFVAGAFFGGISAYLAGENILAGALIGGISGAIIGGFKLAGMAAGAVNFIANTINDSMNYGWDKVDLEQAFISSVIAAGITKIDTKMLGLIDDEIYANITDEIIGNTLGILIDNAVFNLSRRLSIHRDAYFRFNIGIKRFY